MRAHLTPLFMSLYKLLDDGRYIGCTNSRECCACFNKQEDRTMSLLCRETDTGLHLVLKIEHDIIPANQYSLPDYLIERIKFWDAWASDEFIYQYDRIDSPMYGLEAYAISIAAEISACYPECFVDYCGFPVHDEWATREYALQHSKYGRNWDIKFPPVPTEWSYNSTMKKLVKSVTKTECDVPLHGYVRHHDLDYGMSEFHYDPASLPDQWLGYEESFRVDEGDGYPLWLVRQRERMEIMHDIELEYPFDWQTPSAWRASDYIQPFLFDAMSVDILRFSKQIVPISSSPRYVTGSALLELVSNLKAEKEKNPNLPTEMISTGCPILVSQRILTLSGEGDAVSLRQLLEKGYNCNIVGNSIGRGPIHYAATNGHLECLKVLLEYGTNIQAKDIEGNTAVALAAASGHTDCVRYLLEQGANVNDCAASGTRC